MSSISQKSRLGSLRSQVKAAFIFELLVSFLTNIEVAMAGRFFKKNLK